MPFSTGEVWIYSFIVCALPPVVTPSTSAGYPLLSGTFASVEPAFWKLNPVKNSRPVPRSWKPWLVAADAGTITAKLGSEMLPIPTDTAIGAGGPEVAPDEVLVPCEVTAIVPVENVVAVLPNKPAIS